MYNCYISPNVRVEVYRAYIDTVMEAVRDSGREAVIAGDFNAKSPSWGSNKLDHRGEYMEDWIQSLGLTLANDGLEPTFTRREQKSFIDLTLSTRRIATKLRDWKVHPEEETLSLHRYITFVVNVNTDTKRSRSQGIWFQDKQILRDCLRITVNRDMSLEELMGAMKSAQKANRTTANQASRKQHFWWKEETSHERDICVRLRRRLIRERRRGTQSDEIVRLECEYKLARKNLRLTIKRAKAAALGDLCDEFEDDPWGRGYKIVTGKFKFLLDLMSSLRVRK